jgi:colicin import membrane protein
LSKHDDDEIPPGLRLIVGLLMRGLLPHGPGMVSMVRVRAHDDHDEVIRKMEANESELAKRFGKMGAADMIERERMAKRACVMGQHGVASLLMAIDKLLLISPSDQMAIEAAAEGLSNFVDRVEARAVHEAAMAEGEAETKAEAKARAETNGKHEPGTKAPEESKAAAKARRRAESAAAKRKVDPEVN